MTIDYSKYIIDSNLESFRLSMIDTQSDSIPSEQSYEYYTVSNSGKKKTILSSSTKWSKVDGLDYGVTGLYLSPAVSIAGLNTCKFKGLCEKGCIAFTGHMGLHHQDTIAYRTLALFHHTKTYLLDVVKAIAVQAFKASIEGKEIYIRLNGSSDLPFYKVLDMDSMTKDITGLAGFYDYTKYPVVNNPWDSYHLTYSLSERTKEIHSMFDRVAIVVSKKDKVKLLNDYPKIFSDGDLHDIRPLDKTRLVLLQGKRATTKDKHLDSGFIETYESVISRFSLPVVKEG